MNGKVVIVAGSKLSLTKTETFEPVSILGLSRYAIAIGAPTVGPNPPLDISPTLLPSKTNISVPALAGARPSGRTP